MAKAVPFAIPKGHTTGRGGPIFVDKDRGSKVFFWSGSTYVDALGRAYATPLTLPIASPNTVISLVRLSTWTGNCMTVRRASDGATLTIGWCNSLPDKETADAWANGSALTITTVFDQSGNGNNMTQATSAQQPAWTALNEWMGIRPISIYGTYINSVSYSKTSLSGTLTGSLDRMNLSTYLVKSNRGALFPRAYWEFATSAPAAASNLWGSNSSLIFGNGANLMTGVYEKANLGIISTSASSTLGQIVHIDGVTVTSATNVATASIASVQIGNSISGGSIIGNYDCFAFIIYSGAHTAAQMASVEAALNASFNPQTVFTKNLIYGGSSLVVSWQSTANQDLPWLGGFGREGDGPSPGYQTYIMAYPGHTLVQEYANLAKYIALYDAAKSVNVCIIDAPSNDISTAGAFASVGAAQTFADNLYNNTTLVFVAALQAAGYKVVVPTIIARGGSPSFDQSTNHFEDARLRYNLNVINGAAAHGYVVSDRANAGGGAIFNLMTSPANALYYAAADPTHLTNLGYGLLAVVDRAAILTY